MRARWFAAVLGVVASCGFPRPARLTDGAVGDGADDDGAAGDAMAAGPHCTGLAATCGPNQITNCCASGAVPGGTFARGYDVGSDGMFTDNSHTATLTTFTLDDYLVTVGRFRQFVTAGMGTAQTAPPAGVGAHADIANSGWQTSWNDDLAVDTDALVTAVKCNPPTPKATWTDAPAGNENLPINCITWYEAMAFCIWDGGYLPTEAELNYAAVGGMEQRAYPWSSPATSLTLDCSHANYVGCTTGPSMNAVGSESPLGDGKYGQSDLAGEGFEWTLDYYSTTYIAPCNDCADLTPGTNRADRGGGFVDSAMHLRGGARLSDDPALPNIDVVVRCARAP